MEGAKKKGKVEDEQKMRIGSLGRFFVSATNSNLRELEARKSTHVCFFSVALIYRAKRQTQFMLWKKSSGKKTHTHTHISNAFDEFNFSAINVKIGKLVADLRIVFILLV